MRNLLAIALAFALLGGCTIATNVSVPESNAGWPCTPVDPLAKNVPSTPCFRALLTAENEVTLEWRVINALPQVYILNDFGAPDDIGFRPATCASEVPNGCSTRLKVKTGGLHRWQLKVDHADGQQIYAVASIIVPEPFPPIAVYGGGFVDMLSPADRTVSWFVDTRNGPCEEPKSTAWLELESNMFVKNRYRRCGLRARVTIPAAQLSKPGYRKYKLRDCHLPEGSDTEFCSAPVSVGFQVGGDRFLDPNPLYVQSGERLTVSFTNRSGDVRRLFSPTLIPGEQGQAFLETRESTVTIEAHLLTPGIHTMELMSCVSASNTCSPREKLEIFVDSKMDWTLGRNYTDDFLPVVSYDVHGRGAPLEITYDSSGGIWLINEFSTSVEHVNPSGAVESLTLPLARRSPEANGSGKTVKPFAWPLPNEINVSTAMTTLGERALRVGPQIWITQGGGMMGPGPDVKNHSRVISYDPRLTNSPATPFDDRLCVYNVPTDDPNRFGNNQVIGLTAAKGRIWIGESRGLFDDEPSAISSFIPNPDSCDNLLDFEDPEALANQDLQYCGPNQTPEQDGCMEKFLLDKLPKGIKVAQLAADPRDESIWFTDCHGQYLGNLDPGRNPVFKIYPLPTNTATSDKTYSIFRGFPWSIRAENDAVYIAEFANRHLLRFDKVTATFDEIVVPGVTGRGVIPSIEIDSATDRLWFTLSTGIDTLETTTSTIGYIDLKSWREHLAIPSQSENVSGVLYRGLDEITTHEAPNGRGFAFAGIAIDPASGKIALATAGLTRITELTPRAGFWP